MLELFLDLLLEVDLAEDVHDDQHHSHNEIPHFENIEGGFEVVELHFLWGVLVEVADGDGYLVEEVEEGDYLVAVEVMLVAEEDLEGGADAEGLHFAEDLALLAVHAVHNPRDVVNVLLVLLDLGVVGAEELHRLLLAVDQVGLVEICQQLLEQRGGPEVLSDVVRADGVVICEHGGDLLDGFGHYLVQEEQVVDPLWVLEHSFAVLGVVEGEDWLLLHPLESGGDGWRVVSGEMGGYAGVQSADDAVEQLFVFAHALHLVFAAEAILLVDELPNEGAIIIGIGLDVRVDVEVLPLVVLLVLHVPDPLAPLHPLRRPLLDPVPARRHPLRVQPYARDVLLLAPADAAGSGLAEAAGVGERTLLVDVESDYAEELGLDEFAELGRSEGVQLLELVLAGRREEHQQEVEENVESH